VVHALAQGLICGSWVAFGTNVIGMTADVEAVEEREEFTFKVGANGFVYGESNNGGDPENQYVLRDIELTTVRGAPDGSPYTLRFTQVPPMHTHAHPCMRTRKRQFQCEMFGIAAR
jgi:hypothetical protein